MYDIYSLILIRKHVLGINSLCPYRLSDNTTLTFDHRRWKSRGIFIFSCWSIVPSCKIMEVMVQSVSSLQCVLPRFPTMWQYNLDLWPTILKIDNLLSSIIVINCIKLFDPGAYCSFVILPTTFSNYVKIWPWPLTTDLRKKYTSSSNHADQLYHVVG